MPRLDPKVAAQFEHIHPLTPKTFSRPLEGPLSLDAITDFVAQCFANGVPGNAAMGPEGDRLVARWVVPMKGYPRNH